MRNNKFPWNCGDCPMLKTYDMSIDDLTHICLWSKKQIDDCDRYKSAECPLEKHNSELLDKVSEAIKNGCTCTDYSCGVPFNKDCANCSNYMIDYTSVIEVINEMKAEIEE